MDWFWEGNVVDGLEKYFESRGWSLVSKADTRSRQTGVDLKMRKNKVELQIEAKGYPSEMYQEGPRKGTLKATKPSTQARHWYAKALLSAILRQHENPNSIVAIAFPEFPVFTALADRTGPALQKLGLRVLFLSEKGSVRVVGNRI